MKDYARILSKINDTNWLITQGGLDTILSIVETRVQGVNLSDEQIELLLEDPETNDKRKRQPFRAVNDVAILPIMGPIFGKGNLLTMMSGASSLQASQQQLRAALEDDSISKILMEFDTPGGSSDLVEEFGEEIAQAKSTKPIYASVNTMCGSAGLWLASQASKIFITPSGSMGSLGVYTAHTDRSGANLKDGVKHTFISAGRYKTEGNPNEPLSSEAVAHRQEVVNGLMDKFVNAVASGRNLDSEFVRSNFGEGRMLESQQAVDVGMADGVMSYDHLLTSLTHSDQPKAISVAMPGGTFANAFLDMHTNQLTWAGNSTNHISLPDIINGGIVHQLEDREEDDDMRLSAEALAALGLPEDATDEQINTAVTALAPMRDLHSRIDATKKFAEMFPDEHARMVALEQENKEGRAKEFSASYRNIRFADVKVDGENKTVTPTTKGLSGLALQEIEEVFMKSTTPEGIQLTDVKSMLDAVMTGVVDYGVVGSETGKELVDDSNNKPQGNILQVRQQFADKVVEYMNADNISEDAAITVVAERHPDLFAAYKNPGAFVHQ